MKVPKDFNKQMMKALNRIKKNDEKLNKAIKRCDMISECWCDLNVQECWFLDPEFYEDVAEWLRELRSYRKGEL